MPHLTPLQRKLAEPRQATQLCQRVRLAGIGVERERRQNKTRQRQAAQSARQTLSIDGDVRQNETIAQLQILQLTQCCDLCQQGFDEQR